MKLFSVLPWLAALVLPNQAHGSVLRKNQNKGLAFEVDVPRELQSNNSSKENNDGSDASLLNRLIASMLPQINTAFQSLVSDPFDIPFGQTVRLGEIDILFCNGAVDLNVDNGTLLGLSTLSIDDLEVISGTESVEAGWLETVWNATFNINVSSSEMFRVDDLTAGFDASACGLSLNDQLSGGIRTYQPFFQGQISISGALTASRAKIDFSQIDGILQVDYARLEADLGGASIGFNSFLSNVTDILADLMKDELTSTIEPQVQSDVEASVAGGEVEMALPEFLAINQGFLRNSLQRRFVRAYQSTLGLFRFGAGRDGTEKEVDHSDD